MPVKLYDGADFLFYDACELADVPATRRQYRKWTQKRGKAYAMKAEAIKENISDVPAATLALLSK